MVAYRRRGMHRFEDSCAWTDRTKDLDQVGGEWISSVDLENAVDGPPGGAEASVIAVPHPRWAERPLAVVVLRPGECYR